jgi:Cathepsin propeptide inhibitor domain (I29)
MGRPAGGTAARFASTLHPHVQRILHPSFTHMYCVFFHPSFTHIYYVIPSHKRRLAHHCDSTAWARTFSRGVIMTSTSTPSRPSSLDQSATHLSFRCLICAQRQEMMAAWRMSSGRLCRDARLHCCLATMQNTRVRNSLGQITSSRANKQSQRHTYRHQRAAPASVCQQAGWYRCASQLTPDTHCYCLRNCYLRYWHCCCRVPPDEAHYHAWSEVHSRNHGSTSEFSARLSAFTAAKARIMAHNAAAASGGPDAPAHTLALNRFADWSREEFDRVMLPKKWRRERGLGGTPQVRVPHHTSPACTH